MKAGGFRYEPYRWRGQSEWMLVHGLKKWPQAIIIPPLFEEMNFTRAFLVDIARVLAGHGIGSWLPDLPGTGESLRELHEIEWQDWRDAARIAGQTVQEASGSKAHVIAFRGGALLGDAVEGRSWWSFAPADGASLLRQLQRAQLISDLNKPDLLYEKTEEYRIYAGYHLSPGFWDGIEAARHTELPSPHRLVPVGTGMMPWRRAEPARDPHLSATLAADIAQWIESCEPR